MKLIIVQISAKRYVVAEQDSVTACLYRVITKPLDRTMASVVWADVTMSPIEKYSQPTKDALLDD